MISSIKTTTNQDSDLVTVIYIRLWQLTHNIFSAFDGNPSLEVPGVFLDLSKAFDRIWHDGLLYKPKSNGTDDNLLKLIKAFLNN